MNNKLIGILLGITVSIILVGSVLVTATDTKQYRTYVDNLDGYAATIADADDALDVTMSWDSTTKKLIVNDVDYAYSVNDVAYFSNNSMLKVTTVSPFCEWVHEGTVTTGLKTISLTISDGTVSAEWETTGGTTGTGTSDYDWICLRDNAGTDRIGNVITSAKTVYYDQANPIYAANSTSGYTVSWIGDKCYYQGEEVPCTLTGTQYRNDVYSATLSFQNTSNLSGTVNDSETYPYFYAVASSIDCSSQLENNTWNLIEIIPIFVIIAILMMAVGMVVRRDY